MDRLVGVLGLIFLLGTGYLLSENRRAIRWKTVFWGLLLQLIFAIFILKLGVGQRALEIAAAGVTWLIGFANEGGAFVFGNLATDADNFVFAFRVLPIVIFIASFFSCLYYLGVMQAVVLGMARIMTRFMGVSGAESLAAAANVFMGQTEAPIVVAPYIPEMTRSELMALMTGGMATVSGAILGAYIALGIDAEYLISASVMAAPASLLMAKVLIPETGAPATAGKVTLEVEKTDANLIDAAARGASQGAVLAINIAAMLIAFISLIFLMNAILSGVGGWFGYSGLTMQLILGYLLAPVAFLMGVPFAEARDVGQLIGIKVILNELVAYSELAEMQAELSPKARLVATYALCGFANLSSIGIQIGGIGGLAPSRKSDLAVLGLRAVLAGSLASFMTATLAGILT